MIECTGCHRSVNPVHVMDGNMRMETRCPDETCNTRIVEADDLCTSISRPSATTSIEITRTGVKFETTNVLDLAKSRLAVVDAEIAKLRSLEQEQAMLRRMIAAAEPTKKN